LAPPAQTVGVAYDHGSPLSGETLAVLLVVQGQVWRTALRHNSSHLAMVKEAVGVEVGMGMGMGMEVVVVVEEGEGVGAANQEDKTPGWPKSKRVIIW